MADVITRFKLETTQYDSKLRDAAKGLQNVVNVAQNAGKGFTGFSQKAVEAARALGNTASGANNAKDKVKDLVGSFNDAAKAYNKLTEAQRNSDFGKELAASLQTLQGRIREAKQELYGLGDAVKKAGENSGLFGGGKLDGMLQVFGGNLMAKGAGMLAGLASEMGDMVKQGIELARAGEGIRLAFEKLNNPGLLDGLREATHGTVTDIELMKAAVKFNDFKLPLDQLGTMLAFAQQKAKDTGQSVDYMVDSIVTGLGRKSLMILDNLGLSAAEIKEKMAETGDMTKAVGAIIREQMSKAGDYVETAADRAAQATVDLQNKMEELGRKFAPVEEASNQLWTSMKIGILDIIGGPLAELLNGLTEAGRLQNELNRLNGGGNGKESKSDQALRLLREYSGGGRGMEGKRDLYNRQMASFSQQEQSAWREANQLREQLKSYQRQQKEDPTRSSDLLPFINDLTRRVEKAENRAKSIKIISSKYEQGAKEIFNPSPTSPTSPTTMKKGSGTTPAQRAADTIKTAEQEYARALEKAALEVQGGTITEAQQKQKQLQATEALWTAYGKASDTVGGTNADYIARQKSLGDEIVKLGGETKSLQEAQKQAEEAYRQVAAQTQKLANAQEEANKAISSGDLKSFYAADKKITAAGGQSAATGADLSQSFGATTANIDAFIGNLKQKISESEVGTDLYKNLTAQLADATALSNLLQTAIKMGIDPEQMGLNPKEFWSKIFGENPGDYIEDKTWTSIVDKMNKSQKKGGKKLQLNANTGEVTTKEDKGATEQLQAMNTMISSLGSIASGVQSLGIEVPAGITQSIGVLQTIMGIVSAIQSMQTVGTFLGIFANGGIVPRAANGYYVPGNNYSGDTTPVLANAGELILNRAAQASIASQLQGSNNQQQNREPYVTGDIIFLGLRNYLQANGYGDLVTTKSR